MLYFQTVYLLRELTVTVEEEQDANESHSSRANFVRGSANGLNRPFADASLNHLVGAQQHRLRDGEADCLRGPEIYHQLELGRLLDR